MLNTPDIKQLLGLSTPMLRRAGSMLGMICIAVCASPALAQDAQTIDRLTQSWLATEKQTNQLESDWRIQQPLLKQRLTLLQAEKRQLLAVLKEDDDSQNEVDARRAALLAQQEQLEAQQDDIARTLKTLVHRNNEIQRLLPPPLKQLWQQEQDTLSANPDTSALLQVELAKLSSAADFDQRISVHEGTITYEEGKELRVQQLYLGLGIAWYSTADEQISGWGQANDNGWIWHKDDAVSASEVLKSIAIFEKRRQPDFVQLPIHLSHGHVASGVLNNDQ